MKPPESAHEENRAANYTFGVLPSLQNLDWCGFLARPKLPQPPPLALDALRGQPILITGAGGSIGSALALRLGALMPSRMILLEASESNLYALERDWAAAFSSNSNAASRMTTVLGSVADEALLKEIFAMYAPSIVFHAAAFKHVPLLEQQPLAAIENNIFATEMLTRMASAHGARVVLLSTDKAVQPASVMGATKRVAEQIVLSSGGTVLRLGNVLASRDSVAEVFTRQIVQGGPITVTDPEARRYFLTLDEAVNLLLSAALLDPSALFAPVLSVTHNIADLARFLADKFAPNRRIAIQLTGLRPGDKETEILWPAGDRTMAANLDGLVLVEASLPNEVQLDVGLVALRSALDARDLDSALDHLRALVPDYTPSQAVLALAAQRGTQVCL
ncbi:MAG: polysaccharide biosynthesis protein [Terracidiphilus sp.]|jgi:FlaA1/EpsC-like NDP-sugar epimerase